MAENTASQPTTRPRRPRSQWPWALLFAASGATGLAYEVLWLEELRLLFGSGPQAAAVTLSVFFVGLASGALFWGARSRHRGASVRDYALLEFGVAVAAVSYFFLVDAYAGAYVHIVRLVGAAPTALVFAKLILAATLLSPAAFFMGGTLPTLAHALRHQMPGRKQVGLHVGRLYAWNTVGAVVGASVAGFLAPRWLGFQNSYAANLVLTLAIAGVAGRLARSEERSAPPTETPCAEDSPFNGDLRIAAVLAAASGFLAIGLQVAWTRALALVFHNSVYSFAAILVVSIAAMTIGALVAAALLRRSPPLPRILSICLLATGLLVSLSPYILFELSDGLYRLADDQNFGQYLRDVFVWTSLVVLGPGITGGCIFPLALALAGPSQTSIGRRVGQLTALNTVAAALGSLCVGFLLVPWLGLWASLHGLAALYLVLGMIMHARAGRHLALALPWIGVWLWATPTELPRLRVQGNGEGQQVLELWEGSAATVAVVEDEEGHRRIQVDNSFALGGTAGAHYERRQARLPIMIHKDARSVFFLGMGTGITAGGAVDHSLDRIVVAELLPDVVRASETYFAEYLNGLFEDGRVEIVAEDGRHHLLGTSEQFDVIVADLFYPWTAGAGSLYSREHYELSATRLKPGGLYAQWLPLYQLGWEDFATIARTMQTVFPRVTLWRGDRFHARPIVLLLGHTDLEPLDPDGLWARMGDKLDEQGDTLVAPANEELVAGLLLDYCGDLTVLRRHLAMYPVNTDDLPVISYSAPMNERRVAAGTAEHFVGEQLMQFFALVLREGPPHADSYLERVPPSLRTAVGLGYRRHLDTKE